MAYRERIHAVGPALFIALFLVASAVPADGTPVESGVTQTVTGIQLDSDSVLLRIDLQADGTAVWHVEYRIRLDDRTAAEAFESSRTEIEANASQFTQAFGSRMRRTVASAENATGRDMAVQNVTVDAAHKQLPQAYGIVTYTFTWTGFAAVDDGTLRAGDAITGLFLDQETALIVNWPSTHRPVDIMPAPDEQRDRAVVWTGPIEFGGGEPRIKLSSTPPALSPTEPVASAGGVEPTADHTEDRSDAGPEEDRVVPPAHVGAIAIGLGFASAIGWGVIHRRTSPITDAANAADGELLSNEERVLNLLEGNDGRLKQQEVAAAFDWTDAKTSHVVGALREADEIEVFRLGRENVLTLPDTEILEPSDDE